MRGPPSDWLTDENDGAYPVLYTQQVFAVAAAEDGPTDEEESIQRTQHCVELQHQTHTNTLTRSYHDIIIIIIIIISVY